MMRLATCLLRSVLLCAILLLLAPLGPGAPRAYASPTLAWADSYTDGPHSPAVSVDNATHTVQFAVPPSNVEHLGLVDVAIDITFSKSGDVCPGPSGDDDWAEEIGFALTAPYGTEVVLVGIGDYYYSNPDVGVVTVTFTDAADRTVRNLPIQNGAFRPSIGAMADFLGPAMGGAWTLTMTDTGAFDPLCYQGATLHLTLQQLPDLSVEAMATPGTVAAGQPLTYEVTVRNSGLGLASSTVVTHTLPAGIEYVTDTAGCAYAAGQLVCPLGDLGAAASRTFQVRGNVPPDTVAARPDGLATLSSQLQVASAERDWAPGSTTAVVTALVDDLADLSVTKLGAVDAYVQAGEIFTYTVLVDNLGPSHARNVRLRDDILAGGGLALIEVSGDPNRDDSCAFTDPEGRVIECALNAPLEPRGYAPGNGRWAVEVRVMSTEGQWVQNVAHAESADPDGPSGPQTHTADPDTSNNQATGFATITDVADLEITRTSVGLVQEQGQPGGTMAPVPGAVTAGSSLAYTITVTNHGPSLAQNVAVQDRLPLWITDPQVTPSQGQCALGTPGDPADPLTCYLGAMAAGASATVAVQAGVSPLAPGDSVLHSAALLSSGTYDPDNTNDLVTNDTQVSAWADLAVEKTASLPRVAAGREITYTVTVRNDGPSYAPGTLVTDTLPPEIESVAWTCVASGGATCSSSGVGDLAEMVDLPVGGQALLTLRGLVQAAYPVTNTATALPGAPVGDPNPVNNSASTTNAPFCYYIPAVRSVHAEDALLMHTVRKKAW